MIAHVALGFAVAEFDHQIREESPNDSPRIREYLQNTVPPIPVAAPYCAAFVQYCSDRAARALGVDNPLDEVRQEALVASYVKWAQENGKAFQLSPLPGDLMAFQFGGERWDHIGFVARKPDSSGTVWTVEGNTGGEGGEGVHFKPRSTRRRYKTLFIRWT